MAVRKTISYAFDIGDRVYLRSEIHADAPGYVTGILHNGCWACQQYRVVFGDGESCHFDYELSTERVMEFEKPVEADE